MVAQRLPEQFSTPLKRLLQSISFEVNVVGSSADSRLMYAGDYDLMESVPYSASAVRAFRRKCLTRVGKIVDIKCGEVPEWNLLQEPKYDYEAAKASLTKLWQDGVVTEAEYKHARGLLKPHLTPVEVIEVRKELRFGVLRWTPAQVKAGHITYRGRVFYIDEACKTGMTKIDMVAWLKDKYIEISNIITWTHKGKPIVKPVSFEEGMLSDIAIYLKAENYVKVAKRMLSYAKANKLAEEQTLVDLLNTPLGAIYVVVADLQLLEEFPKAVQPKKRQELDWMRDRMAKLYFPAFDDATNPAKLLPHLETLLQERMRQGLEERGLLPLPKDYIK